MGRAEGNEQSILELSEGKWIKTRRIRVEQKYQRGSEQKERRRKRPEDQESKVIVKIAEQEIKSNQSEEYQSGQSR